MEIDGNNHYYIPILNHTIAYQPLTIDHHYYGLYTHH